MNVAVLIPIVLLLGQSALGEGDLLSRAKLAYDRVDYAGALAILRQVQQPSAAVLELMGRSQFMLHDFKRATETFEQAIGKDPNRASAYHWLGRAHGRRAETGSMFTAPAHASKARQNFERAVALDPKNTEALNDLFEYYLQAPGIMGGGTDKAAQLIERIAKLDPAERYYAEARLAEERKDWSAVESHLKRAADLAPQQIGRLLDLGKFLARRGRVQESEAAFARAEKLDPNSPKLWLAKAETYIAAGQRLTEAKSLLERYLRAQLTPDDTPKDEARKLLAKIPSPAPRAD